MEAEPGEGWADVVSKILRMGTNNPESNRILSKAKKEQQSDEGSRSEDSGDEGGELEQKSKLEDYNTFKLKPNPQSDALLENELKSVATRGVVHLFNAVKTVNPRSDKKKKKKKKKKTKGNARHARRRRI